MVNLDSEGSENDAETLSDSGEDSASQSPQTTSPTPATDSSGTATSSTTTDQVANTIAADQPRMFPTPVEGDLRDLELTGVNINRDRAETLRIEFTIMNNGESFHTWGSQLQAYPAEGAHTAKPTGIQIIDPAAGTVISPIATDSSGACQCSTMPILYPGDSGEYFIDFPDIEAADFNLYIPTFGLLSVRGDLVQQPSGVDGAISVSIESSDALNGALVLETVAARHLDQWTLIQVELSVPSDVELGNRQQIQWELTTALDPKTNERFGAVQFDSGPCACSKPIVVGGPGLSGTYFVFLESTAADLIDLTIPGWAPVSGVNVQS